MTPNEAAEIASQIKVNNHLRGVVFVALEPDGQLTVGISGQPSDIETIGGALVQIGNDFPDNMQDVRQSAIRRN